MCGPAVEPPGGVLAMGPLCPSHTLAHALCSSLPPAWPMHALCYPTSLHITSGLGRPGTRHSTMLSLVCAALAAAPSSSPPCGLATLPAREGGSEDQAGGEGERPRSSASAAAASAASTSASTSSADSSGAAVPSPSAPSPPRPRPCSWKAAPAGSSAALSWEMVAWSGQAGCVGRHEGSLRRLPGRRPAAVPPDRSRTVVEPTRREARATSRQGRLGSTADRPAHQPGTPCSAHQHRAVAVAERHLAHVPVHGAQARGAPALALPPAAVRAVAQQARLRLREAAGRGCRAAGLRAGQH